MKTKKLKFGTKNAFFGYFWEFLGYKLKKSYISNDHARICVTAKFCKIKKKNAYFWDQKQLI